MKTKAFVLIELLIVIILIGLMFYLVDVNFSHKNKTTGVALDISSIPSFVSSEDKNLICYDDCSKCGFFRLDENQTFINEVKFGNLDEQMSSFYLDYEGDIVEFDHDRIRIDDIDHDVCLKFRFFANDSIEKMIVYSHEKYYLFPSYFGKVKIFDNLEDASIAYINEEKFVGDDIDIHK